eukprot:728280_1
MCSMFGGLYTICGRRLSILPCAHAICSSCYENLADNNVMDFVQCPQCNQYHQWRERSVIEAHDPFWINFEQIGALNRNVTRVFDILSNQMQNTNARSTQDDEARHVQNDVDPQNQEEGAIAPVTIPQQPIHIQNIQNITHHHHQAPAQNNAVFMVVFGAVMALLFHIIDASTAGVPNWCIHVGYGLAFFCIFYFGWN